MASAKPDIRELIDAFAEDLIALASEVAELHVAEAVDKWQAKNAKRLAKEAEVERKRARNEAALERIQRAAARRQQREEQRAAERALRAEQRLLSGRGRRGPRTGLLAENGQPAAPKAPSTPPQLFVHKRRRDGEIEQLKRTPSAGEAPAAPPQAEAAL